MSTGCRPWTTDEINAIIGTGFPTDKRSSFRCKMYFILILSTGLRVTEAVGIQLHMLAAFTPKKAIKTVEGVPQLLGYILVPKCNLKGGVKGRGRAVASPAAVEALTNHLTSKGTEYGATLLSQILPRLTKPRAASKVQSRKIDVNQQCLDALTDYLMRYEHEYGSPPQPDSWLFPSSHRGKTHLMRNAITLAMNQHYELAGIHLPGDRTTGNHSARKTYIGRAYEITGRDIVATQKMIGHVSVQSTAKYLNIGAAEATAAQKALYDGVNLTGSAVAGLGVPKRRAGRSGNSPQGAALLPGPASTLDPKAGGGSKAVAEAFESLGNPCEDLPPTLLGRATRPGRDARAGLPGSEAEEAADALCHPTEDAADSPARGTERVA